MSRPNRFNAWLTLARPPNLPTVPGDPLAGLCLAGVAPGWNGLWTGLAALGLYLAGLFLNDVADREIDRRERPDRPIPSGRITARAAAVSGALAAGAGLLAAAQAGLLALGAGGMVLGLVLIYTFVTRRGGTPGLIVMGLCRAASVGMGLAAVLPHAPAPNLALAGAAGIGLYITAVSLLAADETRCRRLDARRWLPAAAALLALGGVAIGLGGRHHLPVYAVIALTALLRIMLLTHRLGREPAPGALPRTIGGYIRALLLVQAAYCATQPAGLSLAAGLNQLQPLAAQLGRHFYAS
jgi:4-hydroxybenzoate polyprenyltransferase